MFFQLAEQEDLILRVGQLKNELIWQTTRLQQQKDALLSLTKCEKEQSKTKFINFFNISEFIALEDRILLSNIGLIMEAS